MQQLMAVVDTSMVFTKPTPFKRAVMTLRRIPKNSMIARAGSMYNINFSSLILAKRLVEENKTIVPDRNFGRIHCKRVWGTSSGGGASSSSSSSSSALTTSTTWLVSDGTVTPPGVILYATPDTILQALEEDGDGRMGMGGLGWEGWNPNGIPMIPSASASASPSPSAWMLREEHVQSCIKSFMMHADSSSQVEFKSLCACAALFAFGSLAIGRSDHPGSIRINFMPRGVASMLKEVSERECQIQMIASDRPHPSPFHHDRR